MITYWNPLPTARRLVDSYATNGFTGRWEGRKPRNVPGPFYAGDTDSLQTGRLHAPDHIAYDNDLGDGYGFEFVFRQPVNATETGAMVAAGQTETYYGYAWDGDDHWTVDAVRAWWRERGEIREWAVDLGREWAANDHPKYQGHYHDAAVGLRAYVAFIDDGLEQYLRGYMFWLAEGREPRVGESGPEL